VPDNRRDISRREFIRLGIAGGALLFLPQLPSSAVAQEYKGKPINGMMLARLLGSDALPDPFDFIFCADVHIPFDDRGVFKKIISAANDLKVKFVLIGGDTVQVGNPANFTLLQRELKKFNMPVICAMGNHDTAFEDYADQREWTVRFGASCYKFDLPGVRFIALNNANHILSDADYDLLEESLETDLKKVVFMHRPANFLNVRYDTPMRDDAGRFRSLIEKGGATAVLTGHEHHHAVYKINGVTHIVSGGAGGRLTPDIENNFHHFMLISAGKNTFDYRVEKI